MTAKTDEGGAANSTADPIASADRPSAPAGGIPSIIVDPSIANAAVAAESAPAAPPAHATNGSADEPPEPAAGTLVDVAQDVSDRLSIEDADRFAASIRPSWEPPMPSPVPAPVPPVAPEFALRAEEIGRLPRARKSGILLTLVAVSVFVGLGVLGLLSSRHSPPPSWENPPKEAAKAPESPPAPPAAPAAPEPVAPATPALDTAPAVAVAPVEAAGPSALPVAPTEASGDPAALTTPELTTDAPPAPMLPGAMASPAPEATPPAPAAPEVVAQAAPPKAAPEPPPPAAPKLVKVRISATPAEAELSLDGQSIPNPFEADVIISGKHRVQAKARGHRSADVTVPFDQPQELALRLERLEPVKPRARRTRSAPPPPQKPAQPANRGAGFVSESPY